MASKVIINLNTKDFFNSILMIFGQKDEKQHVPR